MKLYPPLHHYKNLIESTVNDPILKSVIVTAKSNKLIISCTHDLSTLAIVVIYHHCVNANETLELSTIVFNANGNQTEASIGITSGCYHIAVFGVTPEYRIEESPTKVDCITVTVYNGKLAAYTYAWLHV